MASERSSVGFLAGLFLLFIVSSSLANRQNEKAYKHAQQQHTAGHAQPQHTEGHAQPQHAAGHAQPKHAAGPGQAVLTQNGRHSLADFGRADDQQSMPADMWMDLRR